MNKLKQSIINLAIRTRGGLSLAEYISELGLSKSAAYRNLENLTENNLLIKKDKKYYLGPVVIIWLNILDKKHCYADLIHPFLEELLSKTNEIVNLVCADNFSGNYIDRLESPQSVLVKAPLGSELNLYCSGAGRAIMMEFSEEKLREYLDQEKLEKLTPKTIVDKAELIAAIAEYKDQGYATEFGQADEQVHCVAVPLRLGDNIFAISITATLLTSEEKLLSYSQDLIECADKIKSLFHEKYN